MASEWLEVTVDNVKASTPSALSTGPFGSSISAKFFQEHGVPVIRGSNLSRDVGIRLIEDDLVFVSEEKAVEFHRSVARRGDLVFTCWGTIGQVGLVDDRSQFSEYIVGVNLEMERKVGGS
jgi:type I restriction enzyme S subunit